MKGAPRVGPRFFKKRSDHIGNLLKTYFETHWIRFCKKIRAVLVRFARKFDFKIDFNREVSSGSCMLMNFHPVSFNWVPLNWHMWYGNSHSDIFILDTCTVEYKVRDMPGCGVVHVWMVWFIFKVRDISRHQKCAYEANSTCGFELLQILFCTKNGPHAYQNYFIWAEWEWVF